MDEIQQQFLDIVSQIRSHLEYQKALGVRAIETASSSSVSAEPPSSAEGIPVKPPGPAMQEPRVLPSTGLAEARGESGSRARSILYDGKAVVVYGEGNLEASLVFVGESPGQEEEKHGEPFTGPAGQLLNDIIVKGMKLRREDVYLCTIETCRPGADRNPEAEEIEACEHFLQEKFQAVKPRVIVALGNVAVKTLLKTNEDITSLRGKWHACNGIPLMPTYHPTHLLRNPKDKKLVWEDIQEVMAKLGMKVAR